MKQVTIKTGNVEMLVVDLPEELIEFTHGGKTGLTIGGHKVKHLGKATELTEEDWKGIVSQSIHTNLYPHYAEGIMPLNLYCYDTATESGLSLLKANGVVLENTLTKPVRYKGKDISVRYAKEMYQFAMERWQEAESKVWRNCHVFKLK